MTDPEEKGNGGSDMEDAIRFDRMPCIYWSESTKISYLQRRVIVYSIMYYELNESCISDSQYDAVVKQLVRMQSHASSEVLEKTRYNYVMYDFDGSTGFHLYGRLSNADRMYLMEIAKSVLEQQKRSM